jgi:hypothetical protein
MPVSHSQAPRFTFRPLAGTKGELMVTCRPAIHIDRHDIVIGLYHAKVDGWRDITWPKSRMAAVRIAVQIVLALGTDHIEDFEEDEGEKAEAEAHVSRLFPELKP